MSIRNLFGSPVALALWLLWLGAAVAVGVIAFSFRGSVQIA